MYAVKYWVSTCAGNDTQGSIITYYIKNAFNVLETRKSIVEEKVEKTIKKEWEN